MRIQLEDMENSIKTLIEKAGLAEELETIKIKFLGRKGALTLILRSLKDLPPHIRKKTGRRANDLREKIETLLAKKTKELSENARETILKKEWIDVSRPGVRLEKGHLHPITLVFREAIEIFSSMGFETVEGPEVETEFYNFDALNIPANHPAREMWDTFWLKPEKSKIENRKSKFLLRTHTSPVQIRYMEKHNPPVRIIAPGRIYRHEATDASHEIQFHQLEGLMVDKNISIANFKHIIREFFSRLFGTKIQIRLRPSYFPFVEPGFEVDVSCVICDAHGCSVCKNGGWLELAGAGMVHPNIFKAAGYNPRGIQGFAFGFGFDRLVMMKYKINDVRLFHSGDLRFLKQF